MAKRERWYKVLSKGMRSCSGGSRLKWVVGEKKMHNGPVEVCVAGLHATTEPILWVRNGTERVFETVPGGVADRGTDCNGDTTDKAAFSELTLTRELTDAGLVRKAGIVRGKQTVHLRRPLPQYRHYKVLGGATVHVYGKAWVRILGPCTVYFHGVQALPSSVRKGVKVIDANKKRG